MMADVNFSFYVLSIFSLELNSRYQSSWFRFLISCGPCSVQ